MERQAEMMQSGKKCRVKTRTKRPKRRPKVFRGHAKLVNSIDVNSENVDIGTEDHNVNIDTVNIATIPLPDVNNTTTTPIVNNKATPSVDTKESDVTVSSRKVKPIEVETPSKQNSCITGYRFFDMELLSSLITMLACPECKKANTLSMLELASRRAGLSSYLRVACASCEFKHCFYTSSKDQDNFDINKRTVYAMRACGQGHAGLSTFTTIMNMPGSMTAKTYTNIATKLSAAAKEVAEETMEEAAIELKNNEAEVSDTSVSCDGSWQRRGYSSLNGVVTAISMKTGKILDVECMNRTCRKCKLKESLKEEDPDSYAEWRLGHVCTFNYQGTAGGMEPEGTKRIWSRSVEKRNLRYMEFYGDGDSKAFDVVKDTYESGTVEKLECVGHVQKRVGTRLRNLKKREKGLGGRGKLTDATIDRLQNYYGIAIRQNKGNLEGMKRAVMATLFHVASSKNHNLHIPNCPEGAESWCRFNRDRALNTNTYKPGPGLPMSIIMKLRPIYQELSDEKLLRKCLHGMTQNHNEAFNKTIWERIPKTKYVSLNQLEFGVNDAVANFNIGRKASVLILKKMKMTPGHYLRRNCITLNRKRLYHSNYKNQAPAKKKRKIIRAKSKVKQDKNNEKDGESYKSGGF